MTWVIFCRGCARPVPAARRSWDWPLCETCRPPAPTAPTPVGIDTKPPKPGQN